MKRAELREAGVAPERLEEEVVRAFGERARIEAELRSIAVRRLRRERRVRVLDDGWTDLRLAVRAFQRRSSVPLVIVLTLALGIGAGTTVFSLFQAVVLNPLAVYRPSELVQLREEQAGVQGTPGFSYAMSRQLRDHATTVDGIAGWTTLDVGVRSDELSAQLTAGLVTGNYFRLLGLVPQHGRLLRSDDEGVPGTTPHVVLSDALWSRAFSADPAVVGRTIAINERPFTVVGIAPRGYRGTSLASPVDLWVPVTMIRTVARSGLLANPEILETWFFSAFEHVARLKDEIPLGRALAELSQLHAAGLASVGGTSGVAGDEPPVTVVAVPLTQAAAARSRDELLRFLVVLAVVVGIVLAVACVNVANLLLIRARERRRELSIRAAVGASPGRLARQLAVESGLLALCAGAAGVIAAVGGLRLVSAFSLPGGIALSEVRLPVDLRVLSFTGAVSVLCALAFGVAPARAAARAAVMSSLRTTAGDSRGARVGNALIAVQVALSLLLLVTGALLGRSLQEALSVDVGFRSDGVATTAVGLRQHGYTPEQAEGFVRAVIDEATSRPDVTHAAAATRVPIETSPFRMPIHVVAGNGASSLAAPDAPRVPLVGITPGYFESLGFHLVGGRDIEWSDRAGAAQIAVVSENAANRLWPGRKPLGAQFVPMFGAPFTVVGVVRDVHFTSLSEREPQIFVPLLQTWNLAGMDRLRFVAAGPSAARSLAALRAAVHAEDARLPSFEERDVRLQIDRVLMPQRFGSLLLAALASLALLTCAIGIYAVASYSVATRRRELGIRAALGAGRRELVQSVVHGTVVAVIAGGLAGILAAAAGARGLHSLLFGVSAYEPVAYGGAAVMLASVAILSTWVPARRASKIDPLLIIREE